MIRVLVVEDQRALADALAIAIAAQPDLDCGAAVGTVDEALREAARRPPSVVLMDIHLPGSKDGIEGTRLLKAAHPSTRVVVLTADATPGQLARAVTAGASAFLAKHSAFGDILTAIRTTADGKLLVEESTLAARLPEQQWERSGLTRREHEVLALLAQGHGLKTIADLLVLSRHTVRGHVKSVLVKLGAHSQLEAVVTATRLGILPRPTT
ncbi:response regulator transcription factor [Streptomyces sp. NBC_00878]|uniref:response regulator transcription factor n=1 Tax=Streptomyces sp. NBC_00878 TaxID=2975854 RepID=UPI00225329F4|nr:response regulator transcription factor [Streptomyces sp. NBC_00878]MCX4904165.1 response regulator transcription factor [Streptomyces sp. NBC_00878]